MKHICSETSSSKISNVDNDMIQPNAVDLRVLDVYSIGDGTFRITRNNEKIHRGSQKIEPCDGFWALPPGSYEVIMDHDITIGRGEAGYIITRSTFVRNGCFLTSGLYDSGFSGRVGCLLVVTSGNLVMERGTRIGQFILQDAESVNIYSGSYGHGKAFDSVRYN